MKVKYFISLQNKKAIKKDMCKEDSNLTRIEVLEVIPFSAISGNSTKTGEKQESFDVNEK